MQEIPSGPPMTGDVHIQLLGGFAVSVSGAQIPEAQWKSRRARSLVKLLALAPGHRLHRDQVIDSLWPDSDLPAAANNFHQTLYITRRVLEAAGAFVLALEDGFLSLAQAEGQTLQVDVELFETAADLAKGSQNPRDYQDALSLYTGDLLSEDLYEEWTIQKREALRQVHLNLLLDLADLHEARQEYPAAIATLLRLLKEDRAHEQANVGLMRLYALNGQRQLALRQYQMLCAALQAELEAEPSPATVDLYQAIQSGLVVPAESQVGPLIIELPKHNLPVQMSSFVGRKKEMGEISHLLKSQRLVTLTGSGGTGKTRLALQIASETFGQYPDGAWFVDLSPLNNPDDIPQTIAIVLNLLESRDRDWRTHLIHCLRGKHLLMVIDNCEHVVDACASLVNEILQECPMLSFLTTSREALYIAGEITYRVPSLSTPDPTALPSLEELDQFDALQLFSDRASATNPAFRLSADNFPEVASICYSLGGIPLAIELAAARVNVFSVAEVKIRLEDRFRLLTGGHRTSLPRQRTLRASIDWSYNLLTNTERALLQRLSVFSGSCTMESAEAVCSFDGIKDDEVFEILSSLVNKSLVVADHQPHTSTRYRMLETIRQYAQEKLADIDDLARMHEQHLLYFISWIEEIEPKLMSAQVSTVMKQLDLELDNLRAALRWALSKDNQEGYQQELRLFNGLWHYWSSRGLNKEGIVWGKNGLEHFIAEDPQSIEIRARACYVTGLLFYSAVYSAANLREWMFYLEESVALYRKTSNRNRMALAEVYLAHRYIDLRNNIDISQLIEPIDAQEMLKEGLAIVNEIVEPCTSEDLWIKATVFMMISGHCSHEGGPPCNEMLMIQEAIALFQKLGDLDGELKGTIEIAYRNVEQRDFISARQEFLRTLEIAQKLKLIENLESIMVGLGMTAYWLQDYAEMEFYFQQDQELTVESASIFHNIWVKRMQAIAALHQGDLSKAHTLFHENLTIGQSIDDSYGVLSNLLGFAGIAAHTGDYEWALKMISFFDKQMESFFKPADDVDQNEREMLLSIVREKLDPPAIAAFWEEGQAMTLEQAVNQATAITTE